jgi:hypothetical protein
VVVPVRRIQVISAETTCRKQQPGEGVAAIVAMPARLARLGVAWAWQAAATHVNLYVTNVPGPPVPFYYLAPAGWQRPLGRAGPARAARFAPVADRAHPLRVDGARRGR